MSDTGEPEELLTPAEQELLNHYMQFYRDLESGRREPTTDAQRHFVKVTMGQAVVETPHEMAYAKYMRMRARQRIEDTENSPIREPSEGPTEEWGTREDWKRMRRSRNA